MCELLPYNMRRGEEGDMGVQMEVENGGPYDGVHVLCDACNDGMDIGHCPCFHLSSCVCTESTAIVKLE